MEILDDEKSFFFLKESMNGFYILRTTNYDYHLHV